MLGPSRRNGAAAALAALLAWSPAASPLAQAPQEPTPLLASFIRLRAPLVQAIAARDGLIQAVQAQNARGVGLDEIQRLDAEWRSQAEHALKAEVQSNAAGRILRSYVRRAGTMFSEALLTDAQGALVAAYPTPSDYWQGDEAQFQQPWASGELYVGRIGFDESTRVYSAPIAVPVFDDDGGKIGVLIAKVRLSLGAASDAPEQQP